MLVVIQNRPSLLVLRKFRINLSHRIYFDHA